MMEAFEGIGDASTAVRNWLIRNEDQLPAHLKDGLMHRTATGTSPVDLIVDFTEAVYANEGEFKAEAKKLAAAAAVVCEANGFHGLGQDHRGSRIAKILTGEKLAKESTPEPASQHLKPVEPAAEEAE